MGREGELFASEHFGTVRADLPASLPDEARAMTGRQAVLQLRMVAAVLSHERRRGRHPEGLPIRAGMLVEQAAAFLDGSVDATEALASAQRELALYQPPQTGRTVPVRIAATMN